MKREFRPNTWEAFWRTAVDGQVSEEVAGKLKMSVGAVYVAKSRVLARLARPGKGVARRRRTPGIVQRRIESDTRRMSRPISCPPDERLGHLPPATSRRSPRRRSPSIYLIAPCVSAGWRNRRRLAPSTHNWCVNSATTTARRAAVPIGPRGSVKTGRGRGRHGGLPNTDGDGRAARSFLLEPPQREGSLGQFVEFDVLRIVGRGGMGIVFEANDKALSGAWP